MWGRVAAATIIAGLAGCNPFGSPDDPAVTACETSMRSLMKVPSSYSRENSFIEKNEAVLIYEAKNPIGVSVRSTATCRFHLEDGSFKLASIWVNNRPITQIEFLATVSARLNANLMTIRQDETKLKAL
ncbi:hypothetical protein [Microvirga sp. BSC39]|uniref:hypothetical protein n=1 Tax=Microvirga sp. BSC39 TaxID=1549810 RepID=UPI0004E893CC|nr:hypothetical protein [Microvirga sp. BSC39]KFG68704.1 hypothetical protein JH26_14645 [Microvirga sp. BSC39]